MNISKNEIERFRENRRRMEIFKKNFSELPEAKHQALLFGSWRALIGITQQLHGTNKINSFYCPRCDKIESIKFECGLNIEEAKSMLRELIPEHSRKVKEAREKLELDLIPFPRE